MSVSNGSLRQAILAACDIPEKELEIPEWGITVLVRGLTARERASLIQEAVDSGRANLDIIQLYPALVCLACRDPQTKDPIFVLEDREAVGAKAGAPVERIALLAMELSGFTARALVEAEKNFSTASSDSTSRAPSGSEGPLVN